MILLLTKQAVVLTEQESEIDEVGESFFNSLKLILDRVPEQELKAVHELAARATKEPSTERSKKMIKKFVEVIGQCCKKVWGFLSGESRCKLTPKDPELFRCQREYNHADALE